MKIWLMGLACALWLGGGLAMAREPVPAGEEDQLRGIVRNLLDDNNAFVKSHKKGYFQPFVDGQHPRATVVTCADSRVHAQAIDNNPDGDLFMVRNIGNQISTAEGSVEYGVHHLHTPLLLIVGHVACGAIKAARSDYSKESPAIRRELDTIKLPPKNAKMDEKEDILEGIRVNVNNQVSFAMKKFKAEVAEGKLQVIGAIYDFRDDLHQGQGRLVITNINGNTDAGAILSGLMQYSGASMSLDKKAAPNRNDKPKSTEH